MLGMEPSGECLRRSLKSAPANPAQDRKTAARPRGSALRLLLLSKLIAWEGQPGYPTLHSRTQRLDNVYRILSQEALRMAQLSARHKSQIIQRSFALSNLPT